VPAPLSRGCEPELRAGCGCRPLLLTLGLQKHDAGTMKVILQHVEANRVW
jgi:hypothetical protein